MEAVICVAVCAVLMFVAALLIARDVLVKGLENTQKAWLHGLHVQDDCWNRSNQRAVIDARSIQNLVDANGEYAKQVSELCGLRLNFVVMQDQILENVRRTIQRELRPPSETHDEVPVLGSDAREETARITKEELRLVGVGGK